MRNPNGRSIKVLILTDGQKWIVDRISQYMKAYLEIDSDYIVDVFATEPSDSYEIYLNKSKNKLSPKELLNKSKSYDIILFNNSPIARYYYDILDKIKIPKIMYVRSFRFPQTAIDCADKIDLVIVLCKGQLDAFKKNISTKITQIPDGIEDSIIEENKIVAGFVGQPLLYKGCDMIAEACKELNIKLALCLDRRLKGGGIDKQPEQMFEFYRNIDVYICMSEKEGFGAPVLEAYCSGVKHIISTRVGYAYENFKNNPRFIWVDRDKGSLKKALDKINNDLENLKELEWKNVINKLKIEIRRLI